jgi:hypothetical protein
MKAVARTLALSIVVTGLAAAAFAKGILPSSQAVPAAAPVPTCPITGSGGCGVW